MERDTHLSYRGMTTPITIATVPTEVNNLTAEIQVPDFLDSLCLDGLQAVKPEAVKIIR